MTDQIAQQLISTLRGFNVSAEVAEVQTGAAVDRYALKLAPGVKVKQVAQLADDIALAIAAKSVRILAPIPGTRLVGVEVPAAERKMVPLSACQPEQDHPLRFPVGVDVAGNGISARIDKLPHVIVAGQTGSGKSMWTTSVLAHLVTHAEPADLQLILIDPKRVELAAFAGLRHLYCPPATDIGAAVEALDSAVAEMDARWRTLEEAGKRDIAELADRPPYLLVVVDELADLMMTAGKRAETAIVRLLQLGRAAGVHLMLATQRPSTDVITGLIKTNAPTRMVFAVTSHTDSNVALGRSGAERLLGAGDGLWFPAGASQPERIQGVYLSTDELDEMLAPLRGDDELEETALDDLDKSDYCISGVEDHASCKWEECACACHSDLDGDEPRRVGEGIPAHPLPGESREEHAARIRDWINAGIPSPTAPTPEEPEPWNVDQIAAPTPYPEPTFDEQVAAVAAETMAEKQRAREQAREQVRAESAREFPPFPVPTPPAPPHPHDQLVREWQPYTPPGALYTAADMDAATTVAYNKGRLHGETLAHPGMVRNRVMLGSDWALAVLLFVAGTVGGLIAIPALPIAAGVWLAFTVTRRRISMAKYHPIRNRSI